MATSGRCGSSKNVYCEVCGVFVPSGEFHSNDRDSEY